MSEWVLHNERLTLNNKALPNTILWQQQQNTNTTSQIRFFFFVAAETKQILDGLYYTWISRCFPHYSVYHRWVPYIVGSNTGWLLITINKLINACLQRRKSKRHAEHGSVLTVQPGETVPGADITTLAVIDTPIQTHLSEEHLADRCAFMASLYVQPPVQSARGLPDETQLGGECLVENTCKANRYPSVYSSRCLSARELWW